LYWASASTPVALIASRFWRWMKKPPAGTTPARGNVPGPVPRVTLAIGSLSWLMKPVALQVSAPWSWPTAISAP